MDSNTIQGFAGAHRSHSGFSVQGLGVSWDCVAVVQKTKGHLEKSSCFWSHLLPNSCLWVKTSQCEMSTMTRPRWKPKNNFFVLLWKSSEFSRPEVRRLCTWACTPRCSNTRASSQAVDQSQDADSNFYFHLWLSFHDISASSTQRNPKTDLYSLLPCTCFLIPFRFIYREEKNSCLVKSSFFCLV